MLARKAVVGQVKGDMLVIAQGRRRSANVALEMCIRDRYNIVISTEVLNILDIKYVYKTNQEVNYGCT